jgi:hypothetical protein
MNMAMTDIDTAIEGEEVDARCATCFTSVPVGHEFCSKDCDAVFFEFWKKCREVQS